MNIIGISITKGLGKHLPIGTYITGLSSEKIYVGTLLVGNYQGKDRYFEIKSVAFSEGCDDYVFEAKQEGYYGMFYKDKTADVLDIKKNMSELQIVTDEEVIKRVQQESCYC